MKRDTELLRTVEEWTGHRPVRRALFVAIATLVCVVLGAGLLGVLIALALEAAR